jgi:hypothetical protein
MKKIEISQIRAKQFNDMVAMLRDIRRHDVRKQIAELKRTGMTKEQALEMVVSQLQNIAKGSRGISELKEVSNG